MVYEGIYRWDDRGRPVPDLAESPCEIAADGLTVSCHLREARFSDGTR
jgi:ABC-type transport system substrate-binding protein